MDALQTLHNFWSGFELEAYDENTVPDDAPLPYITFEAPLDNFGHPLALTASLWYRDSGWTDITAKEQQISDFITRGGRMIAFDGGAMWIQKASPWAQRMSEPDDDTIRRIVLNLQVEFLN